MPAFQDTWRTDEEVVIERVRLSVHATNGERRDVLLGDLLDALPATHHPAVARAHLACTADGFDETLVRWVRSRLRMLYPTLSIERLEIVWETVAVPLAEGLPRMRTGRGAGCSLGVLAP
jgi:hypothetical protein